MERGDDKKRRSIWRYDNFKEYTGLTDSLTMSDDVHSKLIPRNRTLDSGKKSIMRSSRDEIHTIDLSHCGVSFLGTFFSSTENGATVEVINEPLQNMISYHIAPLPRHMGL
jgi:hypothetical protein